MNIPDYLEDPEARSAYANGYDAGHVVGMIRGSLLVMAGFLCAWWLSS